MALALVEPVDRRRMLVRLPRRTSMGHRQRHPIQHHHLAHHHNNTTRTTPTPRTTTPTPRTTPNDRHPRRRVRRRGAFVWAAQRRHHHLLGIDNHYGQAERRRGVSSAPCPPARVAFVWVAQRRHHHLLGLEQRLVLGGIPGAGGGAGGCLQRRVRRPGSIRVGCAADGTIACWSHNDAPGRPCAAGGCLQRRQSAGWAHSCGLRSDGTIACWGYNHDGRAAAPGGVFSAVSAGGFAFVWVAQRRHHRLLGLQRRTGGRRRRGVSSAPCPPARAHSCGLRSDGTIACWGWNNDWFLEEYLGQAEAPGGVFSAVSAGELHSCGLRSDGTIACWGYNHDGRAEAPGGVFSAVSAGGGEEPIVEPATPVGGSVVLSRGGPGPTSVGEGQGVPCAPDSPTCRYLDVTLAGFAPGTYTVACAHDGWGDFGPSVFWTFCGHCRRRRVGCEPWSVLLELRPTHRQRRLRQRHRPRQHDCQLQLAEVAGWAGRQDSSGAPVGNRRRRRRCSCRRVPRSARHRCVPNTS